MDGVRFLSQSAVTKFTLVTNSGGYFMQSSDSFVELEFSLKGTISEAEMLQLIQESINRYEEILKIADVASLSDISEDYRPLYAWDNPIGLVLG